MLLDHEIDGAIQRLIVPEHDVLGLELLLKLDRVLRERGVQENVVQDFEAGEQTPRGGLERYGAVLAVRAGAEPGSHAFEFKCNIIR